MHQLLPLIRSGKRWDTAARSLFGGSGSYGNGAAMRVAPVGAYFADDLDTVVEQAAKSAVVTHAQPEGPVGAIAVAVAAALATQRHATQAMSAPEEFIETVLAYVPASEVAARLRAALELPADATVMDATRVLGNGSRVSAQDTAPFCIWCAARHLATYEEALWTTLSGFGDRDTTCAIVGGIVACSVGSDGIPNEWMAAREPLPEWDDRTKPQP
jgi:ADP-ribosylglycohydrolase